MRLGFAGSGNMAGAMARGWAGAAVRPAEMIFCDLDRSRAEALAVETEGTIAESLAELKERSDALLLAVKPAALEAVAAELAGQAPPLISVMAATPTAALRKAFPGSGAIRVMPNQPAEVRRGVICWCRSDGLEDSVARTFVAWLEALGYTVELPEDQIEAAMAVMSCAPAYVAEFAERLAASGTAEGLDADLAAELVREAIAGSAELLAVRDPEGLRRAVAPPGGATEAGLEAMDRAGFGDAIEAAVQASLERFR